MFDVRCPLSCDLSAYDANVFTSLSSSWPIACLISCRLIFPLAPHFMLFSCIAFHLIVLQLISFCVSPHHFILLLLVSLHSRCDVQFFGLQLGVFIGRHVCIVHALDHYFRTIFPTLNAAFNFMVFNLACWLLYFFWLFVCARRPHKRCCLSFAPCRFGPRMSFA